jgi:predicted DNA-binding transcriptional regulator AlpA
MARSENPHKQPTHSVPTRRANRRPRKSLRIEEQQQEHQILNPPFDEHRAAKYLGVSHGSLRGWRAKDKEEGTQTAPVFYLAGKQVRYRKSDLDAWIQARLSRPVSVGQ